jgi:transposase-like protein
MQLNCPQCSKPMRKRGMAVIKEKRMQRWYCNQCKRFTVKGIDPEDAKMVEKAVASTLQKKLRIKGE